MLVLSGLRNDGPTEGRRSLHHGVVDAGVVPDGGGDADHDDHRPHRVCPPGGLVAVW